MLQHNDHNKNKIIMQEEEIEINGSRFTDLETGEIYFIDPETGEIYSESDRLVDEKNGKRKNWRKHRMQSEILAKIYLRVGNKYDDEAIAKKSYRILDCGTVLVFNASTKKLEQAYFCKVRLCPMCSWRRSEKIFGQVSKVMNYIDEREDYEYILLSLTAKNVVGENLSSELDRYFRAINLLFQLKEVKVISRGWFRGLEITRNWSRNDYHPHFHVIIAVNKRYFKEKGVYLTQKRWTELWQNCLGIDYTPIVHVRKIKTHIEPKKVDEPFSVRYRKAVSELAKYTVKASHVVCDEKQIKLRSKEGRKITSRNAERLTDETVITLDKALYRRRLVAFGGKFKEVHKLLELDDAVDGNLINTDNEEYIRDDIQEAVITYRWVIGLNDYFKQ